MCSVPSCRDLPKQYTSAILSCANRLGAQMPETMSEIKSDLRNPKAETAPDQDSGEDGQRDQLPTQAHTRVNTHDSQRKA